MAHDPKLEIYKIKLFRKEDNGQIEFRKFFRDTLDFSSLPQPIKEEAIFSQFFKYFGSKLDNKGYNVDEARKKGFTISKESDNKSHLEFSIKEQTIWGILEGGKYGLKRNLGEIEDVTKGKPINKNNIVGDRFFFLLFTPTDFNIGILLIQGYTEAKISDAFRKFLTDLIFCKQRVIKSQTEYYLPETLRKQYLEKATVKSLKFSSGWHVKPDFNGKPKEREFDLEVKIEIIDKTKDKPKSQVRGKLQELMQIFGRSTFRPEGGTERDLEDFDRKNAQAVGSNGRPFKLEMDNDEIKPVILLKDQGIDVDDEGIPDFDEIEKYCKDLLQVIKKDIMPEHAINQL